MTAHCPNQTARRSDIKGAHPHWLASSVLESVLKDYFLARRRSIRRIIAMRMKATEVRRYCS